MARRLDHWSALRAAVVLKLFFVELAQTGTVTRIVSFIGVGLLMLLIGYVAPVPPVRRENTQ
jgi:LPXTG-motif cell wall-anchored protein